MEKQWNDWMLAFRWMYGVGRGQWWRVGLTCLNGIVEVACSLGFVVLSKRVIDIATGNEFGNLLGTAMLAVALIVLQLILGMWDTWLNGCMPVDVGSGLRKRMFVHLLRSRWTEIQQYHSGDLLNRIGKDIDEVAKFVTVSIPDLFVTFVQFVASFAYLCWLDSSLAWMLLVVIPFFMLLSKLYVYRMRGYNRNIRQSDSNIQAVIQEAVQHHLVIKTMEQINGQLALLDGMQTGLRRLVKKRTQLSMFSRLMMSAGFNAGYLLVFLWGVVDLSRGAISFGTMSAFMQLVGRVQRPAFDLASFVPSIIASFTAIERLMELDRLTEELVEEPLPLHDLEGLHFRNVSFSYKEDMEPVFEDWSADFKVGTSIALLGKTGTGKTTLLRLVLALITPQAGRIVLSTSTGEVDISPRTRANFVYVPQGNSLFSGTIRENLLLGNKEASDEQLKKVLWVAAADFVFLLPDGLDTRLGETGGGLSEGQAQRIAIARALLREGDILLFDEATSALDSETEQQLLDRLHDYCKGKLLLFVTHHVALAERCSRVVHLTA